MNLYQSNKYHNKKAFSLLELIVSLVIVGIVIAMLSNILVTSMTIAQKSIARSFVREELASITDRVASDLHAAVRVDNCSGSLDNARCEVLLSELFTWQLCDLGNGHKQVCCLDSSGDLVYASSPTVVINTFSFEEGFDSGGNAVRKNVLFTVVGSHKNADLKINNVLQQTSISTRNYLLTNSN